MTKLAVHLWFAPDDAPRAVELYTSVVPNASVVRAQTFANTDQSRGEVRVWQLDLAGTVVHVLGADQGEEFSTAASLWLEADDQEQLDAVWQGFLDAGGHEVACGWLTDPFGVSWQIEPKRWEELTTPDDPERAQRVVEALWRMTKIDIAGLERAAQG